MFAPKEFLDLNHTAHSILFEGVENVWEVLPKLADYLQIQLKPAMYGIVIGSPFISHHVYIGKNTKIEHGAMIKGPAWIGEGCEIRSGCYIRENVILGNQVIAGNSCEFKNCVVFDNAQVPHFNYVGDSILGYKAHLGAGAILSNVKLDHSPIEIRIKEKAFPTGLSKLGAILGDHAEIGCNAILSPGSLVGRHSLIYPGMHWQGLLPESHIAKIRQTREIIQRRK